MLRMLDWLGQPVQMPCLGYMCLFTSALLHLVSFTARALG